MRRQQIIAAVIAFIVIVAGIAIFTYVTSFFKITLTFSQRVNEITLFKVAEGNDQQISVLKQSGSVSLQKGSYYVVPKGDTISTEPIQFDVIDADKTVEINPDLSEDYMKQKLSEEQPKVAAAAVQAFPTAKNYVLQAGKLFNDADWYGGILRLKTDTRAEMDWYRVIAHKEGGQWKIIGKPSLVITKNNFSSVPQNVIDGTNSLNAEPTY